MIVMPKANALSSVDIHASRVRYILLRKIRYKLALLVFDMI